MNMCKAKSEIRTIYGNVEWNPGPENRQKRVGRGLTNPTLQRLRKKKSLPSERRGSTVWVSESEWLLFNANSTIFQLYHGENKLISNEMMVRSALY
jgi:hypothetical protein